MKAGLWVLQARRGNYTRTRVGDRDAWWAQVLFGVGDDDDGDLDWTRMSLTASLRSC